jgi:mono/diheme cytochrome c family protein/predicted  nucleic acid-binding Zn-ribbon protein
MDLNVAPTSLLRLAACLGIGSVIAHAQEKITYDDHVFPIFEQSCLNCHNPDKTKGGLDLSTYPNTLKGGSGGKVVESGDTASSLLTAVLRTGENKMPPEGDAISPTHIATLKKWIEGGLLENKNASAKPAKKPAFSAAPTSAGKKPEGPPPLPQHVLLEPPVVAPRGSAIRSIVASPWAPLIAVTSLRQVLLIHSESLELAGILPFPEGEPVALAFSPDARYLIVGGGIAGKSGTTVTFDVTTGERILSTAKEFDSILACDIRPAFDIVATGSPSRLIKLWDTREQSLLQSIKKHTDWITALDISPDGILLATGDRNGGVLVWEAATGGEFHNLRAHQAAITRALFRHDSNLLGTSSEDGTLRLWEMNNGSEVKKIEAHPGGVTSFDWASDGTFITCGRDHKVRLWKADFSPLRELPKSPALPTAIAINAEATRAFIGDAEGRIHVMHITEGKSLKVLANNPPTIESRIRSLDEQLTAFPDLLKKAKQQVEEAQAKLDAQQASLAAAHKALQDTKQSHARAQQKAPALKGKIDAVRQNLATKKSEAETSRGQFHTTKNLLEQHRIALNNAQTAGDGPAIEQAKNATRDTEAQLAKHSNALEKLDASIAALAKEEQSLQSELAATEKEISEALAKISPAEAAIKPLRDAIPALEKSLADAKKLQDALAEEPHQWSKTRLHWIAAQTNTRLLQTKARSTIENNEFEDMIQAFSSTAKELESLAAAHQEEPTEATRKALQEAESALITLRHKIEQQAPTRAQSLKALTELQATYQQQFSQANP